MTLEQLLESLRLRKSVDRWGIGTADSYVKSLAAIFDGELDLKSAFQLKDSSLWLKELEASASRLTYCDEAMADVKSIQDSIRDGSEITKDSCLEFDAILTSRRKDRDGDVLESAGMRVDKNMPLLWQHVQMQPIGKHVGVLEQTPDFIKSRFAIADTALGRDAATLVKFGALRMSQGFRPSKFEPIEVVKNSEGKEVVKGWHIHEGDIIEGSTVSIPANTDAVVTAYSREKLHTPLFKSWAKEYYDARPVQVAGHAIPVDIELKVNGQPIAMKSSDAEPAAKTYDSHDSGMVSHDEKRKCEKCGKHNVDSTGSCPDCGYVYGKSVAPEQEPINVEKMLYGAMDDELPGSFEWLQEKLRKSIEPYLMAKGHNTDGGYARIAATFSDQAIVCWHSYGVDGRKCYRVAYKMNDSGIPVWDGDPTEVEITPTITDKLFASFEPKQVDPVAKAFASYISLNDEQLAEFNKSIAELNDNDEQNELAELLQI